MSRTKAEWKQELRAMVALAVPVVLSGVRSALLGLAVILLIYVIQSPRKGCIQSCCCTRT